MKDRVTKLVNLALIMLSDKPRPVARQDVRDILTRIGDALDLNNSVRDDAYYVVIARIDTIPE